MEREKLKKKQLKWRILKKVSLILVAFMILSTIAGFFYFENVVREQKVSDEWTKLHQVSNQINFMTEDIKKFSQSILVDKELQELLEMDTFESEFQRQSVYDRVAKRLAFYNGLRTYIDSSMLQMENGICYGNSYTEIDVNDVGKKLESEELVRYINGADYVYSDPYDNERGDKTVVCYQMKMWDKYHFGTLKATLYLDIDLEYFLEQIRTYSEAYDNVCLLGNDQKILYEQESDGLIQKYLREGGSIGEDGCIKIDGGYLICDSINAAGWKLCTMITNQYLWQKTSFVLEFFVLSFLVFTGLILLFLFKTMDNITQPVTRLSRQMEKIEYGKFEMIETVHTGDEIETLYECFQNMLCEIQKGAEERLQHERQKKEMQFDLMLSQIHPHYLYNVLNTVVYLACAKRDKDVVKIVHSLIYTLQETLNVGERSIETTVEKELELTKCYLVIQGYRYPDMYTVEMECPEELKECLVPKTIIQPLVENAILHGILPREQQGSILVRLFDQDGELQIVVEDDGEGIDEECLGRFYRGEEIHPEKKERKHIGISNVRDRIRYLYGEPYGMEIRRKEERGTVVVLRLPMVRAKKEEALPEGLGGEKA
ncbi:MAG: sensor histidine kinase [Lachnospiraceae bacterium]|nr:sensor histidine kinase [Robinsoniella sp.]MDY3766631.1 sensor histidine kinase [Lachnospiraceae bacterium]